MSLIFRSVKKISKKKCKTSNRNKSKKCCKDPFEDNPTKFVVEDEENRSDFPTLNSVYKTELFGTPLPFRNGNGYDCMKFLKIKTKLQSIVFMNEYMNKSFEELRWEDYQCNRKGSHIFEERNYLRCFSKGMESVKWKTTSPSKMQEAEPLQNISCTKFPALVKSNSVDVITNKTDKALVQPQKIILQRPTKEIAENKGNVGKSSKERSILTNVNKFSPIKETDFGKSPEPDRKGNSTSKSSSDVNLNYKKEEMVKDNLQRYFSSSYSNTSVPYEFYTQNNNYFLPCTNISLAYRNKQTNLGSKNQTGYPWDLTKTNPFGYNSIFDKLDPVVEKGSLYEKLFGLSHGSKVKKVFEPVVEKYTAENKFSRNYFWGRFNPYSRDGRMSFGGTGKCLKSKKHLLGLHVVS